ncbi:HigA family addiction module antidote protein [Candidatus Acetothermia bacterium]|nr:HigA family addiction module antidote protein [Candidatus Acetothermia bacterium]MBI3642635.1 HigA family addiction module antidote protein [Candidatus Acetothermia bacterium]
MPMFNPPHPGKAVRVDCLEPFDLTVTEAAKILGVSRQALNNLVNEKAGVSPEMAIRLAKAFGGSPESWLELQLAFELWQAQQDADEIDVEPVISSRKLGRDFHE